MGTGSLIFLLSFQDWSFLCARLLSCCAFSSLLLYNIVVLLYNCGTTKKFPIGRTVVAEIFSGFSGAAGPRLFTIHQIDASTNNLPKAHTW